MGGDTALFFSLTYTSDRGSIAAAARDALVTSPEEPWEAPFILRALASAEVGMPGSGEGIALVGTVSKAPEIDAVIRALQPFLGEVFRTQPSGRALFYTEHYEASGPGACVEEVFGADEETSAAGAPSQVRHHVIELGLKTQGEEPPGTERPSSAARSKSARSIAIVFEHDDEGSLAARARQASDELRRSAKATEAHALALRYLDDLATRSRTREFVGPKGGLSVWGRRTSRAFDVAELVHLVTPFLRELTDDLSGAIFFFQTIDDASGGCRVGLFDPDESGDPELVVRYHELPFGLTWAPALLTR